MTEVSLCNLRVLCVSVVIISQKTTYHRGTEDTELHREAGTSNHLFCALPIR